MQTASDSKASGGEYIWVPNGAGSGGYATYSINIPSSGDYKIWGRTIAPNGEDDSFYIQIDSGTRNLWDVARKSDWTWDAVNNRGGSDPVIFSLTSGSHTLKVEYIYRIWHATGDRRRS